MLKVKIIGEDGANWSIDKDRINIEYFISQLGAVKIVNSNLAANIYFFAWYNQIPKKNLFKFFKKLFRKKVIAVITNDIRNNPEEFGCLKDAVDIWISPNSKISSFLKNRKANYLEIPFFVSPRKFYPLGMPKEAILKKLKLDASLADKTLIGSFQRDSLGNDLKKPKWQKNPDLLIKICKAIPKEKICLVLAGPRRHYIVNECKKSDIPFVFIGDSEYLKNLQDDIVANNLPEENVNLLYNLADIYIVTSASEGGPKAIMEASLAKTLIFSTDAGMAEDIIHRDLIYTPDNFKKIVDAAVNPDRKNTGKYLEYNYKKAAGLLDENRYLSLYSELFKKIYENKHGL